MSKFKYQRKKTKIC